MTGADLLGRMVARLEAARIPSMLTGSFAAAFHGRPRATQDLDFVIAATSAQLRTFIRSLPAEEYYADEGTALEALRLEGLFNVVDLVSGWKVDLICRKSRPFSRTEFDRRERVEIAGLPLQVATVEDVMLSKLEWAKLGESARQVEDVAGLLVVRKSELDLHYIERWVDALGIKAQWEAARRAAGIE